MSICSKRAPISWSSMVTAPHDTSLKEVLILSRQPGVISFGGGLPAPESFPTEAMARAAGSVFRDTDALQYGSAQGERALLEALAARETARGNPTDPQELLVVTGSQQALDLVTRCLADPGDKVLVESPTYIGALNAIRMTQPRLVDLPRDDRGLLPEAITAGMAQDARFAYVMPTFANPTGLTIDMKRRRNLVAKAREYNFWIVEADPYGEIWYDKEPPTCVRNLAPERTIRLGTLSKILSPGMRIGYIVAPADVIETMSAIKSAMDLNTGTPNQMVAAEVFRSGILEAQLPRNRQIYREHCAQMQKALSENMPDCVR